MADKTKPTAKSKPTPKPETIIHVEKVDDCEHCKKYPRKRTSGPVPCPCVEQDEERILIDGYTRGKLVDTMNAITIVKQRSPKAKVYVQAAHEPHPKEQCTGVVYVIGSEPDVRDAFIVKNPDAYIYRTRTFMSTKMIIEGRKR